MDTMELEGMEFKAYHGCLEKERSEGNVFTVDFMARIDLSRAAATDNLEDTLDYGAVYSIVAKEMETPSNLLEHVAGRIADAIEDRFPEVRSFSVRVSKKNPPVDGPAAWSRITIRRDRSADMA
ncbi:MAG: dihydroneopterin aldolase [Bacteroidales bacterium]|nr:dihydroneopterin aldolase [Bacteroides sp.]MCM1198520.1 dihydroneopterin aldolase [Clostridium sp.]MCM1503272.1 dihydroneopterin aldolase [Bacteroidales bacterium]